MEKISNSFSRYSDNALLAKSENIMTAMTGNPNFSTPIPSLTLLQAAITDFSAALSAAQYRDRLAITVKNQKAQDLVALLQQLGNYVNLIANGDTVQLVSSGFSLISTNVTPINLVALQNFKVEAGTNPGMLVSSVSSQYGVKTYQHQYTDDPLLDEKSWVTATVTTSKYAFGNLQQGKKYWLRVTAVGSNEQVVYTDVVSRYVV